MLFNSTVAMIGSAWMVDNAQKYADEDRMMICTGSQFKWISSAEYFASGELVFIDPPVEAPANLDNIDCASLYLADQSTDTFDLPALVDPNIAYRAKALAIAQRPYTAFAYLTGQTRAPPFA